MFAKIPLRLATLSTQPQLRMMAAASSRAFATSALRPMQVTKPQPASYIKGTVNEPTEYPPPNATHGSYEWSFERAVAISLVPLIAAATVKHGGSGALDGALALTLIVHSHYGINQVFLDYFPKRRTPNLSLILTWTWRTTSAAALYGLYELNTNDIGLTETVARAWTA